MAPRSDTQEGSQPPGFGPATLPAGREDLRKLDHSSEPLSSPLENGDHYTY